MNLVIFAIPHPRGWNAPKLSIHVEFGSLIPMSSPVSAAVEISTPRPGR
jgi:hypothetical protein